MDSKTKTFIGAGAVIVAAGAIWASGWTPGQDGVGKKKTRTVTANVSTFDPDEDINFDLDKYGTTWPDDWEVQQAFANSYGGMDECVAEYKESKGINKTLSGDIKIAVKLNPEASEPFGVNADLPKKFAKAESLNECLREAVAGAGFPTYDGPPLVVEFETELDAGYYEE